MSHSECVVCSCRPATLEVLHEWRSLLEDAYQKSADTGETIATCSDQPALNEILMPPGSGPVESTDEDWRVTWAANHRLRLKALPVLLFTNGHLFTIEHLQEQLHVQVRPCACALSW